MAAPAPPPPAAGQTPRNAINPAPQAAPVRPAAPPSFTFTATDQPGPPGGYGTWRFATGTPGQRDLLIALEPIPTGGCDHRHEAKGHDPGVLLRHLTQIRHATCTGPGCRRPSTSADFEHNIPYEAGGRTCLCNGNPTCRHDHRPNKTPAGTPNSSPPATSAGPPRPAGNTSPNPPATPLSELFASASGLPRTTVAGKAPLLAEDLMVSPGPRGIVNP